MLAKRLVLSVLLKLLILAGLVIFSIPFVGSLIQSEPEESGEGSTHYTTYNVAHLARGEIKKIKQFSSEVWVYHRTSLDIEMILAMPQQNLRDALSQQSDQPAGMLSKFRSLHQDYFVFIPFETRKQCQVQQAYLPTGGNGFTEVCYRGYFDTAGRVLSAGGHKAQKNLMVPPYQWQDEHTLLLDRRR